MSRGYLDAVVCPVCGKSFIPAPKNIYKIKEDGKLLQICNYTCFKVAEERKPKRHYRRL